MDCQSGKRPGLRKRQVALNHLPFYNIAKENNIPKIKLIVFINLIHYLHIKTKYY